MEHFKYTQNLKSQKQKVAVGMKTKVLPQTLNTRKKDKMIYINFTCCTTKLYVHKSLY